MRSGAVPIGPGHLPATGRQPRLSRQARTGRAVLVAVFSTLIALVSHVLAGGAVPALPGILIPLAFSVLVCLPLSGRVLSLPRLALSVVASQLLFHSLFVLGAAGPGVLVLEDAHPGHAGHVTMMMLDPAAGAGSGMGHSDGWMWVAHGIAAVATILLIRHGEAAIVGLWALAGLLVRALSPRIPRAASPLVRLRVAAGFLDGGAAARWMLASSVSRRGPPGSVALALF